MIKLNQKLKNSTNGIIEFPTSITINMVKVLSLFILMLTLISASNLFATTYYSKASATDANARDSWNSLRDGSGSRPSGIGTFTNGNIFVIQNGHTLSTSSSWSISGTGAELNIETNATLNIQSSHILTVQGQLVSYGSITGYSLSLTGTDSAIDTLSSATLQRLTTSQTSNLVLMSNVTVSSTLTMTSGNIVTGNNILELGTGISVKGTLTYTTGKIIGSFKRWFNNSIISGVLFPVGTATQSRAVSLNRTSVDVTNGAGSLTAKFVASDPGNNNASNITDGTYLVDRFTNQGYWEITKGATGTMVGNYSLDMETNGFAGILDITKLRIIKRPDSVSPWVLEGTHTNGVSTTVKRSGLSNFSQFTLGGNSSDNPLSDSPLPVTLSTFTSSVKNNGVTLNWSTASEINNKGFEIERKESNSNNFVKVGFVDGKGTTNQVSNYSFNDSKLNSGKYSYRIKQIDFNGNFEYFSLNSGIEIGAPKKFTLSQNYPNPFNPSTKIDYEIPADSKVQIHIYDISGKEVMQVVNEYQKAGYYTAQFNASQLSSGTYFYKLISGNDILTKKMTLVK